jgi:hypothetical protein
MNERIKQLAEQATKKYDRLGNEIPFAQPDLEKFAELIVQESVQFLKDCNSDFEAEQLEEFWDL